jgi:hypothetical protein
MIAQAPVPRAGKLGVTESAVSLPSVRSTLAGWFRPLVLGRVTKTMVDFEVKEVFREQGCRGVIQPHGPQELKLKPEGQRSWNWQLLHTTPDVNLETDERFKIKNTPFRVMSKQDWSEYGYVTYELVQDYQSAR